MWYVAMIAGGQDVLKIWGEGAHGNVVGTIFLPTLISLINVGPKLTDFGKFHPHQNKNPPSTIIEILDFSTSTPCLLELCTSFFQKNPTLHV